MQILLAISYAKIQDDTDATFGAEGSPKSSIAAQPTAAQQSIREEEDRRRRIEGRDWKLCLQRDTDV